MGKDVAKQIDPDSASKLRTQGRALADPALREAVLRLAARAAAGKSGDEQALGGVHEQRGEQQDDGVFDDLADELQVAAIAPDQVENRSARDDGERDEQQQSDENH